MTVANHYVDLRKIPPSNVHYLDWDQEKPGISGKAFREKILLPVMKEIEQRGLAGQIDYLIYSCDFPWKVNFASDFPDEKFTPGYQPQGSITGSTYLGAFVKAKRKEMFGLNTNFYFVPNSGITISRGFHAKNRWLPGGKRADLQGIPYLLSMMLGVTYGHGNSVEEIIRYLQSAREADATHPRGTVYFLKHSGPRSTPRHHLFPEAVRELGLAGVKAEIIKSRFPQGKKNVIGLTVGVPTFDMAASGCRMLPGSIGDNLTSTGGVMHVGAGQTPLTDFLRYGAAGACGTVHEPLNYPQKFPSPFLHVHYAHGCSLAEAFYQSIHGPFQQLLVGDPLCQPWANIPEVKVAGPTKKRFVSGSITLTPAVSLKNPSPVRHYDLFVDGIRRKRCRPGGSFRLDTTKLSDGLHELRVVALDKSPIETQGRWIGQLSVKNGHDAVQLSIKNQSQLVSADYVVVKVASTQKNPVLIMHNHRELAKVPGGNGSARIAVDLLGSGPITLQARVEGTASLTSPSLKGGLFSKPVRLVLPLRKAESRKRKAESGTTP
ncbi:MAG: TIGR03790 family protein [Planctomycetes bacterium]|nr:TIGR03790 family protein [Planctomycetota bacterium]